MVGIVVSLPYCFVSIVIFSLSTCLFSLQFTCWYSHFQLEADLSWRSAYDLGGSLNVPNFRVAVLTSRDQRFVVEPNQPGNLRLRMGILNNGMLGRVVHKPNDDSGIE